MTDFIIHFLISNLFISGIIGLLMAVKHLFRNSLSGRMQYHLWFCCSDFWPFLSYRCVQSDSPGYSPGLHSFKISPCHIQGMQQENE